MHPSRFRAAALVALFAVLATYPADAQFLNSSPAFAPSAPVKKPRVAKKKATPATAPATDQAAQTPADPSAPAPEQPPTLGAAAAQPAPEATPPPAEEAAQPATDGATAAAPVAEPTAPATEEAKQEDAAQPPTLAPLAAEPQPETAAQPDTGATAPADLDAASTHDLAPALAAPPAGEKQATQTPPAETAKHGMQFPSAEATAALTSPPKVVGQRAPYPPPNEGCRNTESFPVWLARFKRDAAGAGIKPQTISSVLGGMGVDNKVISRDRGQKFFAQSFLDFQNKLATQNRVVNGRKKIAQHKDVFDRVQHDFGVPPSVITGFWALESDFGAGMGKFPILPSLVTLAYDCRRQVMFQEELKAALQIIDRGDLRPSEMIGSWAGEIGQTQFLPTRYLDHAVDYDGDGRIDLFRDEADVIGTTANYMRHLGWRPNEPWLEEVRVNGELPWDQADLAIKLPRSKWAKWGITYPNGKPVPADNMPASLLLPMGRFGPAFLAYPNFDIYTEWNNSLTYATTAAYLATRIDGAGAMSRGRGQIPELDQAGTKELQQILASKGYDVGKIDGLAGSKTRAAVKDMQIKLKMPADSYPTPELLSAIRGG